MQVVFHLDLIVFIHLDNIERSNFSFIPMTLPVFNRHEKLYETMGFSNVPLSSLFPASVGLGCKRHLDSLPLLRQVLQRGLNVADDFHDTAGGRNERKERTFRLGSSFKPSQKK